MWESIGLIAGSVLGPVLAFLIARYWQNVKKDAERAERDKANEKARDQLDEKLADETKNVNDSIDKQRDSMEKWKEQAEQGQPQKSSNP